MPAQKFFEEIYSNRTVVGLERVHTRIPLGLFSSTHLQSTSTLRFCVFHNRSNSLVLMKFLLYQSIDALIESLYSYFFSSSRSPVNLFFDLVVAQTPRIANANENFSY